MSRINIQKTLENARKQNPYAFDGMSDQQLLKYLQVQMPNEDWGTATGVPGSIPMTQQDEQSIEEQYEGWLDTHPIYGPVRKRKKDKIAKAELEASIDPQGIPSKLALSTPLQLMDNWEWAKKAYNQSNAGMAYATIYGKPKYDTDNMPTGFLEDGLGMLLGMLSPAEITTFVVTGAVGSKTAQPIINATFRKTMNKGLLEVSKKKGMSKIAKQEAKDKIFNQFMMKSSVLEGGLGLGTYSAASGAIQNSGAQRIEMNTINPDTGMPYRDEFDFGELAWETAKSFGHGTILGGMGGMIKTPMARKFALASREGQKKGYGWAESYIKLGDKMRFNPAMQVGMEAAAFSTAQTLEEYAMSWYEGKPGPGTDFLRKMWSNTLIVGGMRSGSKIFRTAFTSEPGNDVTRYFKAKESAYQGTFGGNPFDAGSSRAKRFMNSKKGKELVSALNIKKSYEDAGLKAPKELLEKMEKLESELHYEGAEKELVLNKLNRLNKLTEKALDKDGQVDLLRLDSNERAEWGSLATEMNTWQAGMYQRLRENPEIAYKFFEKELGNKPVNEHAALIDKLIESKINEKAQISDIINKGVSLESNSKILAQLKNGETKFDVSIEKNAEGTYNVKLKNSKGEVVESTVVNSEAQAKSVEKLWKKDIKDVLDVSGGRPKKETIEIETPKETPIDKPPKKVKSQQDIENEKVSDLASYKKVPESEIRKQYESKILNPDGTKRLDIEAIDRALKAERKARRGDKETKDTQTLEDILEGVKDTDKKIESGDKAYTERMGTKGPERGKPQVIPALNKLITAVKNAKDKISDVNRKIISYVIRTPEKIAKDIFDGKAPSTLIMHTRAAINFAKFLKGKDISLLSDYKTLEKAVFDYMTHLRAEMGKKGKSPREINDALQDMTSHLKEFYMQYVRLGKGETFDSAKDVSQLLGDKKRLGLEAKGEGAKAITVEGGIEKQMPTLMKVLESNTESITVGKGKNKITLSSNELKSLIETFYKTGARPEDIIDIRLDMSESKPKLVWKEGKHGEKGPIRGVIITEAEANAYKKYIIDKKGEFNNFDAIFPNLDRVITHNINLAVGKAFDLAGIKLKTKYRKKLIDSKPGDITNLQAGRIFRIRKASELTSETAKAFSEKLGHKGGVESTVQMGYFEPESAARKITSSKKSEKDLKMEKDLEFADKVYPGTSKEKLANKSTEEIKAYVDELNSFVSKNNISPQGDLNLQQYTAELVRRGEMTHKVRDKLLKASEDANPSWTKEKRTLRVKGETIFKGKEANAARVKFLEKVLKKNKLTDKELKEAGLSEGVLGEFAEGIIKLQKGEWQPSDFYHENLHRLKSFAEITNNSGLKKLISRAEKLAVNTKEYKKWKKNSANKGRDVEEFLADIVGRKASRMEFSKGMLPKVKQVVNQIISKVKNIFGVGNFNDLSRVLAGKVRKGFATEGVKFGKEKKFKKTSNITLDRERAEGLGKLLQGEMKAIFKRLNVKEGDKDALVQNIADLAGIKSEAGEPIKFTYKSLLKYKTDASTHYQHLKMMESQLKGMNINELKRKTDVKKWFNTYSEVENLRVNLKNVTKERQKFLLESLGVEEGNIWKANLKQLTDYRDIVHQARTWESSGYNFIDTKILEKAAKDPRYTTRRGRIRLEAKLAIYPVYKVLEQTGFKNLSLRLKSHFSAEAGHLGKGYDAFLNDVTKGYYKDGKWVKGIGDINFNRIKDYLWSSDHKGQRMLESIELLKTNPKAFTMKERRNIRNAEKFFRKAFKKEFFTSKDKNLKKFINTDTVEGRVVERYVEFMKYYEKMTDRILMKNMSPAQYEKFKDSGNLKFIKDGIYLTRQMTKKFKELVDMDSKEIRDIVKDNQLHIAEGLAKEKYDNPTKEQINSFMNEAKVRALENLYDASNFRLEKITSKFLMKRGAKFPEFIKKDGKYIRVYETSFDKTAMRYAIGMSKFLATMEFFPEFANIKGFKKSGAKAKMQEMAIGNRALGDWMKDVFAKRIGVGEANPFEVLTGIVGTYSNALAKVGLSSPKTGIKNLVTGTVGTLHAFDLAEVGRGIADVIRGESRQLVKTGKDSLGLGYFEEGRATKFFEPFFFTGLMKPTERFNRNLAILTSKVEQRRLFNHLDLHKKGDKLYERAVNRLQDFYELTPKEVELIKKYGLNSENVSKDNFQSTRDFVIEKRNVENAIQKMDTMAHVKTQGSSASLFMPKFASGSLTRPLTLYKRMAYAATFNTFENLGRAFRPGKGGGSVRSMSKLLVGSVGTYYGGALMMGIMHFGLGQAMPKENSSFWRNILTVLWKGEMLGILSEMFSPFNSGFSNTLSPAVHENALAFAGMIGNIVDWETAVKSGFTEWKGGKKFLIGKGQAGDDFLRSTLSIYNDYQKVMEKRTNPYNRKYERHKDLYRQFEQEVYKGVGGPATFETGDMAKYKKVLKNAFIFGNEEEFWRTFIATRVALTIDYWNRGYADHKDGVRYVKTPAEAEKLAVKELKRILKDLNPNPTRVHKDMASTTLRRRAKYRNWLQGITEDKPEGQGEKFWDFDILTPFKKMTGKEMIQEAEALEREYDAKIKQLLKVGPYWLRKWNETDEMKSMLKDLSELKVK